MFFSSKMDSQVNEDNFQLLPVTKEANLGKENDTTKFDVFFEKYISMLRNWYIQNPRA